MDQSPPKPKQIRIAESGSLAKTLFWGAVTLAGFIGLLFFLYQGGAQMNPPEFDGKVVDKWAGYTHSDQGSFPYFRLLVQTAGGTRSTVAVDQETYDRAKVGMCIKKTKRGIELSALMASSPDVRTRLKINPALRLRRPV